MASDDLLELVLIGAGPTTSSLLERLVASVPELVPGRRVRIHLVDPHVAGAGRVWRPDLHPLLWMNSMAEDVTMFTDETVRCDGPLWPGPTLFEWSRSVPDATLAALADDDALVHEIRHLTGTTFPTRRVQSVYLRWFHHQVLDALPEGVEVVAHPQRAIDLVDLPDGRQRVVLDAADPVDAHLAVLALGHLDAEPDPTSAAHGRFAAEHGLVHVAAGHTADLDLSVLEPGADVIVLGFGQAFTDLMVLVSEGRGGRFVDRDGRLAYEPSGLEPVLHVGSRRGVPYRSKLEQHLAAPLVPLPRFLDDAGIEALLAPPGQLEFRRDVLPVLTKEVAWAYYHELFVGHPDAVSTTWDDFAERFAPLPWGERIDALVAATVPDVNDHFEIARLDRPLAGLRWDSIDELQRHVADQVAADVTRRTDQRHSADLAAFTAMLGAFVPLGRIGASGRLTPRSRVAELGGWWFSFFMYYASGPPPQRLRQLLALIDAGLVRVIGAGTKVETDSTRGRFVARSTSHPDEVVGTALVDARIATASVIRTADPLLRSLSARGEVREEQVNDVGGWSVNTGKVEVMGVDLRIARADGTPHPRRHALGAFTNRPAAGTFARPRTNAASFRQHDVVARSILQRLPALADASASRPVATS